MAMAMAAAALSSYPSVRGCSSMRPLAPALDVRISVASSTGRLDLSHSGLEEVPSEVFSIKDLVELSLAGNCISHLPDDIVKLKNLRRLGLAGNRLSQLPASIAKLEQLEGLWIHGNILRFLPEELSGLNKLRVVALAGNRLRSLPDSITSLSSLQILSVAGNRLNQLPYDIGKLTSLKVLALYGNFLQELPESIKHLKYLQDLWLQGNDLKSLPDLSGLSLLQQLSLADNLLSSIPDSICKLHSLKSFWLYGNRIAKLPSCLDNLENLSNIWLESNPLEEKYLQEFLPKLRSAKAVGLDTSMSLSWSTLASSVKTAAVSQITGTGSAGFYGGYFKLERFGNKYSVENQSGVIVVAFGSAPAVPNWGRLLKKVKETMLNCQVKPIFDILYVVDSRRSWYTQARDIEQWNVQDESSKSKPLTIENLSQDNSTCLRKLEDQLCWYYKQELKIACQNYKRVIMLGDSMGGSAALMFSCLATSVIAFCPQVDLASSTMRPGADKTWLHCFKEELLNAVTKSQAKITVHCGIWVHDLQQVNLLPSSKVCIVIHNVDDHRIAKELDENGVLVALVKSEIEQEIKNAEHTIMSFPN